MDPAALAASYYYDESSPTCLRRLVPWVTGGGGIREDVGSPVGSLNSHGYYRTRFKAKTALIHRVVYALHHGPLNSRQHVDHIDGDRTNNKIANLRLASFAVNNRNHGMHKTNRSGVVGVHLDVRVASGIEYKYWCARWNELDGTTRLARYSLSKMGDNEAFSAACQRRSKEIARLNEEGAGYTTRHGG